MAAIVYNGLQSCLESHVIDSKVLRLKLSPLPSPSSTYFNSQSIELALKSSFWDPNCKGEEIISKKNNSYSLHDCNLGGFSSPSSLKHDQTLLGMKEPLVEHSTNTANSTYVPLMAKRSSLVLSERSLQLCTENLGNETGTDMSENCIGSLENEYSGEKMATTEQVKPALPRRRTNKAIDMHSFPPLTTIRGSESLSVTCHREEGRLVVKAVKVSSSVSCFQAERSHGRLRLFFLKNTNLMFDSEEDETEQENEGIGKHYEEQVENDINGQREKMEAGGKVDDQEEQEQEHFQDEGERDVEDDIGMEKLERPRRCKESEHETNSLLNWDAFLVATS